jgi:RHS repeat-associated protein
MDGSTVAYAYDNIGQLKVANSSVFAENRGYSYDRAWNLTNYTINSSSGTYLVNNLNELTNQVGGYSLTYDANGNRTDFGGYYNYAYDDENRLTQMSDDVYHSFRTQFVYDGLGRLRQRLEYTWTGTQWSVNATVSYLYDGWRVIQERDGNNVPTVSYTRGNDLSGSLEGAGGIGGLLARSSGYSSGNWSTNNVYQADGNGNITFMLNSSQTMVASYRYDSFGNKFSSSGSLAAVNTYRFSSKEIHVNSGMYYYGYRFYDPSLQRWLNRDPIEENGGVNLYGYVENEPVHHVDPLGLSVGNPLPNPWPILWPILFPPKPPPTIPPKPPSLPTQPVRLPTKPIVIPPRLPISPPVLGALCLIFTPTAIDAPDFPTVYVPFDPTIPDHRDDLKECYKRCQDFDNYLHKKGKPPMSDPEFKDCVAACMKLKGYKDYPPK